MAKIVVIDHAATNWEQIENKNFDSLNQQVTSMISDSGWTNAGMVLLNGTVEQNPDKDNGKPQYRFVKLQGPSEIIRILSVRAVVKGSTASSSIIGLPEFVYSENDSVLGASFGDFSYRATLWTTLNTPMIYLDMLNGSNQTVPDSGISIDQTFMY
ncbi:hypothetical protein ACFP1L_11880 [Lactiplantibacillus nangangensis]|uniref:Uncharacterized protein n=1 Tax=Lactiplantibacillus nangangensis TaxID=2559917 RepID=A0ABW1SLT1_9LACO|nr:hypothetical protein [Lactiplantibacillus nangangensis]